MTSPTGCASAVIAARRASLAPALRCSDVDGGAAAGLVLPALRQAQDDRVEQLHRGQQQTHAATRAGFHALIHQMLGVNLAQPFQREGWPGTVPQQTLLTFTVVCLDAHPWPDREAAAVFPCGHGLRVFR